MSRHGIALAMVALAACAGDPQAPTPLTTPPVAPLAPPVPHPPAAGGTGNDLAGSYALTIDIGSGCGVIPAGERIRRYDAVLEGSGDGRYLVTLGDAAFLGGPICSGGSARLSDRGCQQFFAVQSGEKIQFVLANENDDTHGGHIVERLPSGAWMEIIGSAGGRIDASSIQASGRSSVWYCPTSVAYPFPCFGFAGCASTDMQLTLTRR